MKLARKANSNCFDLKNLTLGKLEVIKRALKKLAEVNELGPVGEDMLIYLQNQELRKLKPFTS
jgi:hypothetical protein